jgi:plastocyanin
MYTPIILALGVLASAATIDIDAGENGFEFAPSSATAAVGDTVRIHFYPGGHSFVSSDFNSPCTSNNVLNSGIVNSNSGQASMMYQFTVNDTNPIWFYCGTPGHCAAGMSGVINPPYVLTHHHALLHRANMSVNRSNGNTLKAYQSASNGKSGQIPSNVEGGALVANVDTDDDDNSSSSAPSSTSASGSSSPTASASATGAASSTSGAPIATQTSGNAANSNFAVMPLMMMAPIAAALLS